MVVGVLVFLLAASLFCIFICAFACCICLHNPILLACTALGCNFKAINSWIKSVLNGTRNRGGRSRNHAVYNHVSSMNTSLVNESAPQLYDSTEMYDADDEIILTDAYIVPPLEALRMQNNKILPEDEAQASEGKVAHQHICFNYGNFKDIWCGILFLVNVITIISMCFNVALTSFHSTTSDNNYDVSYQIVYALLSASIILALVATVLGTVWLSYIINYSEKIITLALWINVIGTATGGVITVALSDSFETVVYGIFLIIVSLINYCYMYYVRDRIPFASAILNVASNGIKSFYMGILGLSYSMLMLQFSWFIVWSIATFSVYYTDDKDLSPAWRSFFMFILLVSLYWGSQVIINILQTTICGIISTWYFQPNRDKVVLGSLFRSCTYSFGSICLGSLLVAIIHALREIVHYSVERINRADSRQGNMLRCIVLYVLNCLLSALESLLLYFNKYSFCYIASWGDDYFTASSKVRQLFSRRGWSIIVNDNLIINTLTFSSFAFALVTAGFGAVLSFFYTNTFAAIELDSGDIFILFIFLGFFMGYSVGSVLTTCIASGAACLLVCFAESSDALQSNHPVEYDIIFNAWAIHNPSLPLDGPKLPVATEIA